MLLLRCKPNRRQLVSLMLGFKPTGLAEITQEVYYTFKNINSLYCVDFVIREDCKIFLV